MFGFVYLWFDRKRQKFCIGSHVGTFDDGYISSTGWMLHAYNKRPQDFKRRILFIQNEPDRKLLLKQEQRWLDLIKVGELGVKYYNLKRKANGGNGGGWKHTKATKILLGKLRRGKKRSPETQAKLTKALKGKPQRKRTPKENARLSLIMKQLGGHPQAPATCLKISKALLNKPKSKAHVESMRARAIRVWASKSEVIWINNGASERMIEKAELVNFPEHNLRRLPRIWINNGTISKMVMEVELVNFPGYIRGRCSYVRGRGMKFR
jgi:NUMOD3 motif